MTSPLLTIHRLCTHFGNQRTRIKALDDVSFSIPPNTTLGIVGESGSGKTTLGKTIIGIHQQSSGSILYQGKPKARRFIPDMQYIFQDSSAALNPRMSIEEIIMEPLQLMTSLSALEQQSRARKVLELVGLSHRNLPYYPHQFSGGQRQRIAIARALTTSPRLIICDEPTSSLDVSIQAQIIALLLRLQKELGLTYLFISHDLALINYLAHEVAVLRNGKIVEHNTTDELFTSPQNAYTKMLIDSALSVPY